MKKEKLPEWIKKAIERLERERGENVEVMNPRKGIYYAYAMTTARRSGGKPKTISKYIGRIGEDGTVTVSRKALIAAKQDDAGFPEGVVKCLDRIRKKHRRIAVIPTEKAYYIYDVCGDAPVYLGLSEPDGSFIPEPEATERKNKKQGHGRMAEIDKNDRIILSAKSMNSRIPTKTLSALSGLGEGAVINRIRKLERAYGIRYMAEINLEGLGYREFVVFIRFLGDAPREEELAKALAGEPEIQFAAAMKGNYDIMIYAAAAGWEEISKVICRTRENPVFRRHAAEWYCTPFEKRHGYIPPRDQFFDIVEKEKVWRRTRETPKKRDGKITINEFITLRELNSNGLSRFTEIDERYGLGKTASKYAYKRMRQKSGIVSRTTLTMQNVPARYIAVMMVKIVDRGEFNRAMEEALWETIREIGEATDRYLLGGRIQIPDGILCIAPVFWNAGLPELQEELESRIKGVRVENMVMTDILVGKLCYRLSEAGKDTQMPRGMEYSNI